MTAEPVSRTALARLARIRPVSRDGSPVDQDLGAAIRGAPEVFRYRRTWHLGGLREVEDRPGVLLGRIGYGEDRTATRWSRDDGDFVPETVEDGDAYLFVVDTASGQMAYQAGASSGVLSHLQAMINAAGQGQWVVERVLVQNDWATWRQGARIIRFSATLRRPNPDYVDRERIEQVMEPANARVLKVALEAEPGQTLDLESEFVREALAHAQRYGNFKVDAVKDVAGQEVEQRYASAQTGGEEVRQVTADRNGTATPSGLVEALPTIDDGSTTEAADDEDDDEPEDPGARTP